MSIRLYQNIERYDSHYKIILSNDIKKTGLVVDDFYWKCYSIDLRNINDEVLTIPLLLNIAPVIWANDLVLELDFIDETLQKSLMIIKDNFKIMYPSLEWSGTIENRSIIGHSSNADNIKHTKGKPLILFSGGLDSVFSVLSHLKHRFSRYL